jgi:SpoVK/Ycf46/Vps4 family AAA+-type ATPase
MKHTLLRWTRNGTLSFPWSDHETLERLALSTPVRERIERAASSFRDGRDHYQALQLTWRRGWFLYGASGTGKTAASRALARALGWNHLTLPAHEILDANTLEHALAFAVATPKQVITLEDVDLMVKRMEPEVFFSLLDHAMARGEGQFWIATSRHPESAPKTQLVRPGRFDESVRMELPGSGLRGELLMKDLLAPFHAPSESDPEERSRLLSELVESSQGLSFAHFEELRQIAARLKVESRDSEIWEQIRSHIQDQIIAGDRWGGASDATAEVEERVRLADPRVLQAALDMTDVFRALIEKTIGDAAERARHDQNEGRGSTD